MSQAQMRYFGPLRSYLEVVEVIAETTGTEIIDLQGSQAVASTETSFAAEHQHHPHHHHGYNFHTGRPGAIHETERTPH